MEGALLSYLEEDSSTVLSTLIMGNQLSQPRESRPRRDFYVASFVADVCQSDPDGFDFLETIVKGIMLTEVLLFPDLGGIARRFGKLEVYFDTAFVLQALGFEGESKQASRIELLRLLYEENGNLRVFQHTLNEIRSVLSGASYALRNYTNLRPAYGPTTQHLMESGYTSSDVELIMGVWRGR